MYYHLQNHIYFQNLFLNIFLKYQTNPNIFQIYYHFHYEYYLYLLPFHLIHQEYNFRNLYYPYY